MSLSRLFRFTAAAVSPSAHFPQAAFYRSAAAAPSSSYHNFIAPNPSGRALYRRISPVGDPNASIVPILDRWIDEGNSVEKPQLVAFIKEFRRYGRLHHALEISTWMTDKRLFQLSSRDAADRLDLIAKVQGIEPAVEFFETLPRELRDFKTYGALLNCYCRIQSVGKAEALMQSMNELGIIGRVTLCHNNLLCLYRQTGDSTKFERLLEEMDDCGIPYDVKTYNILISAYGAEADLEGMEKTLKRMESDPCINPDWKIYQTVGTSYRRVGLVEKAVKMLEKSERLITKRRDVEAYYYLLTSYAALGEKDRVLGVWERLKKKYNEGKVLNRGYMIAVGSLTKLGDFESAQRVFDEWDSSQSSSSYDVRIPNVLVGGYVRSGRLEEAEGVVERVRLRGVEPLVSSWVLLAVGYLDHEETMKAVGALRRGVSGLKKSGWKLGGVGVAECLERLRGKRECLEEVEELIQLLKDGNVE